MLHVAICDDAVSYTHLDVYKRQSEYRGILDEDGIPRAVCDYIAGMTDNYALEVYHALFIPRSWEVKAHGFT